MKCTLGMIVSNYAYLMLLGMIPHEKAHHGHEKCHSASLVLRTKSTISFNNYRILNRHLLGPRGRLPSNTTEEYYEYTLFSLHLHYATFTNKIDLTEN